MKKFPLYLALASLTLSTSFARADGDFITEEAKVRLTKYVESQLPGLEISEHVVLNADGLECIGIESMMGSTLALGTCVADGYDDRFPNSSGIYQITVSEVEGANTPKVELKLLTGEI